MNTYIKLISFCLFIVCLAGCRKFIDETPVQNSRVLEYTDDYVALVNNREYLELSFSIPNVMSSDDVEFTAPEVVNAIKQNPIYTQVYTWTKPFYTADDYEWNFPYRAIYQMNVIIEGIMSSKNGIQSVKQVTLAEALVHRAMNYFVLVNLYAKQYDEKTAATDPGVPLLLKPQLFTDLTRAPVKTVYEQLLADLQTALPLLPLTQVNNMKPTKATAFALLSKIYLNMRSFGKAAEFADSALAIKGVLADYNAYVATPTYTFPTQFSDKEVILRKVPRNVFNAVQLSPGLLALLSNKDIRYKLFVQPGSRLSPAFTGLGFFPRDRYSGGSPDKSAVGLTVPDVWLTKAECLARAGEKDKAMQLVNDLRKLRFSAADYADLTATDAADALRIVVEERRREFFGSGLRWFDQRRLNKDPQFAQTVTRTFDGKTFTLQPNSNSYVFPIANILIGLNPEIEQNPN
jgi:tetratricopeptide (TPR) repeat protein